jgi:hypothetical protein
VTLDKPRLLQATIALSLAAACAALFPAGCREEVNRTCDKMCDCTGCSQARFQECLDGANTARTKASELGCSDQFNAYLLCVEQEVECRDDKFDYDGCEEEEKTLRECGVTVFRNLCEVANQHQQTECMAAAINFDAENCVDASACQAQCVIDVSCAGLTGRDPNENQRFGQCIQQCVSASSTASVGVGGGPKPL